MITLSILLAVAAGIVLMVVGFFWVRQPYDIEYQYYGCFSFVLGVVLFIVGSVFSVYFLT